MPLTLTMTEGVLPKGTEKATFVKLCQAMLKWHGLTDNPVMTPNVIGSIHGLTARTKRSPVSNQPPSSSSSGLSPRSPSPIAKYKPATSPRPPKSFIKPQAGANPKPRSGATCCTPSTAAGASPAKPSPTPS